MSPPNWGKEKRGWAGNQASQSPSFHWAVGTFVSLHKVHFEHLWAQDLPMGEVRRPHPISWGHPVVLPALYHTKWAGGKK